jgi:RNA ligase (TIGR02306 family)
LFCRYHKYKDTLKCRNYSYLCGAAGSGKKTYQKMSERKLASIQKVLDLQPIEGADLIELAIVNGWKLVVKRGEFNVGDLAIYCEIDSMLPICEQFEFLRKSCYKVIDGKEGFRLKTIKLKGQISQGLLLPKSTLKGKIDNGVYETLQVGDNVTSALGVWKYEPPIPAQLAGVMRGSFPSFIPKTDEERVQNLADAWGNFKTNVFYVTEKLDGSSATFYHNNGVFGVCSRNIDLLETEDNTFWRACRELNIHNILSNLGNIAIQGELIGEGIQGNPYKIKGHQVWFFNAFDIDRQQYLAYSDFVALVESNGLKTVPVLSDIYVLPETIDELLKIAEGKSVLNSNTEREGLVIRSHNRNISFKAISNNFLLKEK